MSAVSDASVDAIFSSHSVEHVYAHEVPQVLKGFERVLAGDGFVVLTETSEADLKRLAAEHLPGELLRQVPLPFHL